MKTKSKRTWKQIISLFLSVCMVITMMPVTAFAADMDFTYDGLDYKILTEDGEAGTGTVALIGGNSDNNLTVAEAVYRGEITYTVTQVGDGINRVFPNSLRLGNVTISDTVTTIANNAFRYAGINTIDLGNSLETIGKEAFRSVQLLETIAIPDSVKTIEEGAFGYPINLKEVTFGSGSQLETIGIEAFKSGKFTDISIPDSVISLGQGAFSSCEELTTATIGNGVKDIGANAFQGCTKLNNLTIGTSVETIGNAAFSTCKSLIVVNIPDTVTKIGANVFNLCSKLSTINIPASVKEIGNGAFYSCSALTNVTIPNTVETIGEKLFHYCTGLETVTVGNIIGAHMFNGCSSLGAVTITGTPEIINEYAFFECTSLQSITIPDSVKTIDICAFARCSNLSTISWGKSLETVGPSAFYGTGFTALTIPDTVTSIGNGAFANCNSLTNVTIGKEVNAMDNQVFMNCANLKNATFLGDVPDTIYNQTFQGCASLTAIYVPEDQVEAYKAKLTANTDIIKAIGSDDTDKVTTSAGLKTALEATIADTINVAANITLTDAVTVGAEHTLSIDSGLTLTIGDIASGSSTLQIPDTETLTITGEGNLKVSNTAGTGVLVLGTMVVNDTEVIVENSGDLGIWAIGSLSVENGSNLLIENSGNNDGILGNVTIKDSMATIANTNTTLSECSGLAVYSLTIDNSLVTIKQSGLGVSGILNMGGNISLLNNSIVTSQGADGFAIYFSTNSGSLTIDNSVLDIKSGEGLELNYPDQVTFTGVNGGSVKLSPGVKISSVNGKMKDGGHVLTNGDRITVGSADDTPSADGLTAGNYIWDGTYFTKVGGSTTAVSWSGLTANGAANTIDTTELTLTFDVDPTTLAIDNIMVTGATKGNLTGVGTTRTLSISGITVAEEQNVTVAIASPSGFAITPPSKTVAVHRAASGSADTEITDFAAIANVDAGTVGSATYANAAAVIDTLPSNVTANYSGGTVFWPVSAWVDTDNYNPATVGSYTFTATLGTTPTGYANSGGHIATVEVVVSPASGITPTITTIALLSGNVRTAYSQPLVALGTAPITWSITSGNLPYGLTLNSDTGVISGTPATEGIFTFGVRAQNYAGAIDRDLSIQIYPAETAVYSVTFDLNGGTRTGGGELTQTVPEGSAATAPIVTRSNYTFTGWDKAFTNVTSNLTVKAGWSYNSSGGGGGSSGGGSTSTTQPTIPTADGSVKVEYTTSNGVASVSVTNAQVDEIIAHSKNEEVVLDLQSVRNASAVNIPNHALNSFENADLSVAVRLPAGTATINNETLASILAQGPDADLNLELNTIPTNSLTTAQQEAVKSTDLVFDINIFMGTQNITEFDGLLTIDVPYKGELPVAVWYLNDKGESEKLESSYENGVVSFVLNHLSLYVVGKDKAKTEVKWINPFIDVKEDSWFYEAIKYVYENDLMKGTGVNTFSPNGATTRGMIVTILHRLEGSPLAGTNIFSDVKADKYYANAVAWASESKIVSGYGNDKFGPEDSITREQLAAILMNYAKFKGYDVTAKADLSKFKDLKEISNWAKDAISWANADGLIQGDGTKLMPIGNATRAQVAAILNRFVEKIGK